MEEEMAALAKVQLHIVGAVKPCLLFIYMKICF